jgi:hypothetical protein
MDKITAVHIKLKSIDLIDELLSQIAGTEDDGELSAQEVLSEIKSLIIQDWLAFDAIPRAQVQAAIVEMRGQPPFGCDTWEVALDILQAHCGAGVVPSVAKESLTTETEVPNA